MTISHQFLDTAHQFGLDNMSASAALDTLNQSILGNVVDTRTSWTSILQPGETGTITITFSNGFTRTSEILNSVDGGAIIKSITILRTDTNEVLWDITGDIPFSLTDFSAALQNERVYSGDDTITGNSFNNILRGYLGNDLINGGSGTDSAFYLGFAEDHTISPPANNSITVNGGDGVDKLVDIERLKFDDTRLAFDLDGNAGHVANLIGAIFGKETLGRKEYVGIGLDLLDNGMTYADLTDLALRVRLGEGFAVTDEISLLFQNLLGVQPSENDLAFWANTVTTGQHTPTSLAQLAAETDINGSNIKRGLLAQEGVEYADSGAIIALAEQNNIDSLLGDYRWGEGEGTGTRLTYSFRTELSNYSTDGTTGYGSPDGSGEPWREGWVSLSEDQLTAIKASLVAWADVANIRLTEIADSDTVSGDIRFSTLPEATVSTTYLPSALDMTGNPIDTRSGDVWLSPSELASLSEGSVGYAALLREAGHALGLVEPQSGRVIADPSINTPALTVMGTADPVANPSGQEILLPTTPMLNDIAAIQYIYGANQSTRSDDTVYSWSGGQTIFETIWDGGGVDTINWSNQFTPAKIDLNAGSWSFLGPERWDGRENTNQNLAIANNVVIENANGGGRDDTIIGNAADNIINGGSGDDELVGGEGNDLFDVDAGLRVGNDSMFGGSGNDTYSVDSALDKVVELEGEGIDLVVAFDTYSIEDVPHVENLFLFGDNAINGTGNDLANLMRGNGSDNVLSAGNGRDTLNGFGGNDILNGGLGIDTAIFSQEKSNFSLSTSEGIWTVSSNTQDVNETGTLTDVERIRFLDVNVALDLDGNAGDVAKIIGAVFGKEVIAQKDLVGIGLNLFDSGTRSYTDIMQLALDTKLGAGFSDSDEVVLLYQNLLGITPTEDDLNLWTGRLASGEFTHTSLAEFAANTGFNLENINFVGLQQTGIEFI